MFFPAGDAILYDTIRPDTRGHLGAKRSSPVHREPRAPGRVPLPLETKREWRRIRITYRWCWRTRSIHPAGLPPTQTPPRPPGHAHRDPVLERDALQSVAGADPVLHHAGGQRRAHAGRAAVRARLGAGQAQPQLGLLLGPGRAASSLRVRGRGLGHGQGSVRGAAPAHPARTDARSLRSSRLLRSFRGWLSGAAWPRPPASPAREERASSAAGWGVASESPLLAALAVRIRPAEPASQSPAPRRRLQPQTFPDPSGPSRLPLPSPPQSTAPTLTSEATSQKSSRTPFFKHTPLLPAQLRGLEGCPSFRRAARLNTLDTCPGLGGDQTRLARHNPDNYSLGMP